MIKLVKEQNLNINGFRKNAKVKEMSLQDFFKTYLNFDLDLEIKDINYYFSTPKHIRLYYNNKDDFDCLFSDLDFDFIIEEFKKIKQELEKSKKSFINDFIDNYFKKGQQQN